VTKLGQLVTCGRVVDLLIVDPADSRRSSRKLLLLFGGGAFACSTSCCRRWRPNGVSGRLETCVLLLHRVIVKVDVQNLEDKMIACVGLVATSG